MGIFKVLRSKHLHKQNHMNRLVLIDGNAILHRAYHALPPLTAPDGSIVNAVYGFVSILIKIFNDLRPTHMAVAFDRPEKTFRKELFKDYQGKRPEMETDLVSQIPKVQDVVRAFGIPIYDAAGFEADDVIGTLCRKSQILNPNDQTKSKSKIHKNSIDEVIIVTGDKDILQLVDDKKGVKVFMPTKGLSEGKLFGEAEVIEKMGVAPKQIPDLKALMGDSSDNYPGVPGIGPKTAVKLLAEYGSVEKLLEEKKIGDAQTARLGLNLATIRTDVPVAVGELPTITILDTPEVRGKLEEFHFPSLIKRLGGMSVEKKEKKIKKATSESQQLELV